MNLYEYQAKELLRKNGILTPKGLLIKGPHLAERHFEELGGKAVLKAQIHAGGRGKAGGIRFVTAKEELFDGITALLGKPLVTTQTDSKGEIVEALYLEEILEIEREMYLSISFDRTKASTTILFSPWGGMSIEEVAKNDPEKLASLSISPLLGLCDYQLRELLRSFGDEEPTETLVHQLEHLIKSLYQLYQETDLQLLEINPLVVTKRGLLVAADAKITIDDNALFRQPYYELLYQKQLSHTKTKRAEKLGFSFVELDGNIGCLVNGAGLAMATMDAIDRQGGAPANFLDIGGGATSQKIKEALELVLEGDQVNAVFVNVFGGINHCDVIAKALLEVLEGTGGKLPFVVRLQGKGKEKARKILKDASYPLCITDSLESGAFNTVKLSGGQHGNLG